MNRIAPLGDSAVLVGFGDDIDLATNLRVHALDAQLQAALLPGVIETVPAYATLLIHYDQLRLDYDAVAQWLRAALASQQQTLQRTPRQINVPVRYGGEYGPDLASVADYHHASEAEIIRLHSGREYTVFMMGFTPGFPYMGKLDDALATSRLETPRTRVPAGSVGIAGLQTGIYPIESPGGWRLIGRTSLSLFNLASSEPFVFAPGDRVRFIPEGIDA